MAARDSVFQTWSNLPVAGVKDAIQIARAGDVPCRVLVRCLTGTAIISFDANEINVVGQAVSGRIWRIPAGQSDSLVMNPGQTMSAAAVAGAAVAISVAVSDAYPVKG